MIVTKTPFGVGDGETESDLPFFDGKDDRLPTLIRLLEDVSFDIRNFQNTGEQNWMKKTGILMPSQASLNLNYLKTIGYILYQSLFPSGSQVNKIFHSSLRSAEINNVQLHLRLKFEAEAVSLSRLADYPWELLYDGQDFLVHQQVVLSRYIATEKAPPHLASSAKINVLLIAPSPIDPDGELKPLPPFEKSNIHEVLDSVKQAGHIKLNDLHPATSDSLRAYLTEHCGADAPKVLHFDGHGYFGKLCEKCRATHRGIRKQQCRKCGHTLSSEAQGYLVFEKDDKTPDFVSASELGALVHQSSLRDSAEQCQGILVVVLTACQSGMAVVKDSVFNGIAQHLILDRVPAVIAMQYSVTPLASAKFAKQFYRAISQKNSLVISVNKGREAMGTKENQWYRPVLYLRWADNEGGQLFVVQQANRILQWRTVLLVSLVASTITLGSRFLGYLQPFELWGYDQLIRLRLDDQPDSRLMIVEVTKNDLENWDQKYRLHRSTLPDAAYNQLLKILEERYRPKVIGLDVYRPFTADRSSELAKQLKSDSVFTVCKHPVRGNSKADKFESPPETPLSQLGFTDFVDDTDNTIRRYLFQMEPEKGSLCPPQFAFSLQIALRYLQMTPTLSEDGYRIGNTLFLPLNYPTGGYWNLDDRGHQILLNYIAPEGSPRNIAVTKNLSEILHSKFVPESLKGRIVLIGVTDPELRDYWSTPYGGDSIPGLFVHAQMVSQVLRILQNREKLRWVWPPLIESVWILAWSMVSGLIRWRGHRKLGYWVFDLFAFSSLVLICAITFVFDFGWLPLIPSIVSVLLTILIVFLLQTKRKLIENSISPLERHYKTKL